MSGYFDKRGYTLKMYIIVVYIIIILILICCRTYVFAVVSRRGRELRTYT